MKNLYSRFSDLTGARRLRTVGICISTNDALSTIQYPSGAFVRVAGVGAVGHRYFVRAGQLDGEAPNLTALTIEV